MYSNSAKVIWTDLIGFHIFLHLDENSYFLEPTLLPSMLQWHEKCSKEKHVQIHFTYLYEMVMFFIVSSVFRWFKFTLKPPNSITHWNFFSAIWDTSHWNFFVKFGLKTPYDIS